MLVPILRAAHCRSTHHFFAIDALERIGTQSGRRLGELLLKHYARYLKGSKDPDDSFKDFQNHVIHVSQNNWGGAARACEQWHGKAMAHLQAGEWSDAAYACGVLSHYFTDPIMPLHTGQTEKESVVHRPMEWSICKAYEEIYATCQFKRATYQLTLKPDSDWIAQAVLQCAAIAHTHYVRLIEIYNLPRGIADPPRGLTKEARAILADLFDLAMGGWAAIVTRMAADMTTMPPDCSLSLATVIAGLDMPRAMVVRKFSDAAQRAEVQRIFDEYTETGKVVDNLPAEIKVVRREFAADKKKSSQPEVAPDTALKSPIKTKAAPPPPPIEVVQSTPPDDEQFDDEVEEDEAIEDEVEEPVRPTALITTELPRPAATEPSVATPPEAKEVLSSTNRDDQGQDIELGYDSPLVDAPSIGPKTAARFTEIDIHTIGQFVDADAAALAEALQTNWITQELIEDWQDQAALVCEVDVLCGYKAQLLVAIDCRSADDLAAADPHQLHSAISQFAASKEGQRILRKASQPKLEDIQNWIEAASQEGPTH